MYLQTNLAHKYLSSLENCKWIFFDNFKIRGRSPSLPTFATCFPLSASGSVPVIDVDIGKDDGRRSLAFVTLRQHFALRLVKSVLSCRWLERVRSSKFGVLCRHQLLEIPLQRVQTGAVVDGLRQWDVPRKVAEHRFLLVDGLRLAAVVVDVRLERGGLDVQDRRRWWGSSGPLPQSLRRLDESVGVGGAEGPATCSRHWGQTGAGGKLVTLVAVLHGRRPTLGTRSAW